MHKQNRLLDLAELNYPSIAAKKAETEAVRTGVSLAGTTFLPSMDAAYQVNYATYYNITGMYYPGRLIPISGPPPVDNIYEPVPGSTTSLTLKWAPLTFGQRSASVDSHRKRYDRQVAEFQDEVLRIKCRVAYFYLEIAAVNELIIAYAKNIMQGIFMRYGSAIMRSLQNHIEI